MQFEFYASIRKLKKKGGFAQYIVTIPKQHIDEFNPPIDKLVVFKVIWKTLNERAYKSMFGKELKSKIKS
jgi:hypothetical protein